MSSIVSNEGKEGNDSLKGECIIWLLLIVKLREFKLHNIEFNLLFVSNSLFNLISRNNTFIIETNDNKKQISEKIIYN